MEMEKDKGSDVEIFLKNELKNPSEEKRRIYSHSIENIEKELNRLDCCFKITITSSSSSSSLEIKLKDMDKIFLKDNKEWKKLFMDAIALEDLTDGIFFMESKKDCENKNTINISMYEAFILEKGISGDEEDTTNIIFRYCHCCIYVPISTFI